MYFNLSAHHYAHGAPHASRKREEFKLDEVSSTIHFLFKTQILILFIGQVWA
jgi:hypothetical protein